MIYNNKDEFEKMNILYWRERGYTGKGTNIVVLDVGGVPLQKHKIIEPLRVKGKDEKLGHKTHVCGIIREILPKANIYAFNWGSNYKHEILEWIKVHQYEIDVINCSFEGVLEIDEFSKLKNFNIPVMGAIGNSSNPYGNNTSSFDFVTGIIAWIHYFNKKAGYSNYGLHSDFSAYTNIYYETDKNKEYMFGGTSCAASVASALIGMYGEHFRKSYNRPMNRQECFEFQLKYIEDVNTLGKDDNSGYGILQLPNEIPLLIPKIEPPLIKEPDTVIDMQDWDKKPMNAFVTKKELLDILKVNNYDR